MQMSLCHKCNLPVYFAERKTSLGKDWHRTCLRCAECDKVLHPGQHAQHKGTPYCDVPCYSALFGPRMFGHGSPVEAHNNFGHQAMTVNSPVKKPDLQAKLKLYNNYYEGKKLEIRSKEVNGRLVLEGPLRIHWGVQSSIKLAEKDESPASKETWRRSYTIAMANGLDEDFMQALERASAFATIRTPQKLGSLGESPKPRRSSLTDVFNQLDISTNGNDSPDISSLESPTKFSTVVIRGDSKRRRKHRRLSIINGHIFNVDTSIFTPAHGSITSVTVTSLDPVYDVLKQLLAKFKVENNPDEFCLCTVKSNGETHVLKDDDYPLLERVILGPLEDTAKLFIMDQGKVFDVDEEVAQFVTLPDAVLKGFLHKLQEEEKHELTFLTLRFQRKKKWLEKRLSEFNSTNL